MEAYITVLKIDSQRECPVCLRELKHPLCIHLEGRDGPGDGREVQEGRNCVYLWLIYVEA